MDIVKERNGSEMCVKIGGRMDTNSAPQLEEALRGELDGVSDLTLDFEELEYISSSGLRVILSLQKIMNKQGSMKIVKMTQEVKEIFEVTGFTAVVDIVD